MITCLIVDDEQHAVDILTHYVGQTPFLQLAGATTHPIEALELVNSRKIDLIFVDIQMPEISGIELIKAIQGKSRIILTTAYSEFATEGFELEVVDYLLKPISLPRFLKAVHRALNIITSSQTGVGNDDEPIGEDYFFVKTEFKGKMLKINLKDIDYIEGMKNYVGIHHNNQKTMCLLNMKDLEERLPRKHFMRVHRSFIVAVGKITAVEGNQVVMKGIKTDILLGETYRAAFFESMKGKIME